MGDYLDSKVEIFNFGREKTNMNLIVEGSRKVGFSIPFIVHLARGDKLHFSQATITERGGQEDVITHNDYRDVEITRKNENDYFLKLNARDMRLLENVKRDYQS